MVLGNGPNSSLEYSGSEPSSHMGQQKLQGVQLAQQLRANTKFDLTRLNSWGITQPVSVFQGELGGFIIILKEKSIQVVYLNTDLD